MRSHSALMVEALESRVLLHGAGIHDSFLMTPNPEGMGLAIHEHTRLQLFLNDQAVAIPADVGVSGHSSLPVHTHSSDGTIHIESTQAHTFSLADFFTVWKSTKTGSQIVERVELSPQLQITVNGATASSASAAILGEGRTIIVRASGHRPADEGFLRNAYIDLLGREIDPAGRAAYIAALDSGTTREEIVSAIQSSSERLTSLVNRYYAHYLHRAADQVGLDHYRRVLAQGGDESQLAASLMGSLEYRQRFAGADDAFIQSIYADVFDRGVDASGRATWVGALAAGVSREMVAAKILDSDEALTNRINDAYRTYLHREADASGLAHGIATLRQGVNETIYLMGLLTSSEYSGRGA